MDRFPLNTPVMISPSREPTLINARSSEDFHRDGWRTTVPSTTTWADVAALGVLFCDKLGGPGASADRIIQARGKLRYLGIKVLLKVVDLGLKGISRLLGRELGQSIAPLMGGETRYRVGLFAKPRKEIAGSVQHGRFPEAAGESPEPSTGAEGAE